MSKPEAAQLWAERLQRFDSQSTTVAAFFDAEGVTQPAYYYWRRKLRNSVVNAEITSR
ncbi:hypothetical protein U8335_27155 [Roseiconus lacunae]|uniref:IS66 family insertion sequence element accessory protein TnpA n=1 Tax=Roseiconus lacunae TaxID=2605694 RepID=UPI003091B714|nr:hypothetical protein U8335_27155 [Stieleria sp. HD01]